MASFSVMLMSNTQALFANAVVVPPATQAATAIALRHLKLEKAKLVKQMNEDAKLAKAEWKAVYTAHTL